MQNKLKNVYFNLNKILKLFLKFILLEFENKLIEKEEIDKKLEEAKQEALKQEQ